MWSVVKSVLSALLGVQNDLKRQQDFSSGNPAAFIVVGIVITLVFVLILVGIAVIASR
ncbi:DUF2970 domain-containing protein [Halomonas sp. XH26]|uniref:DUF2970 domain-containing protein n=1 Tax=Vreelandella alkaliphila TaxID=272774 RepID=A0AAJ2RRC1_9GAMM|nr:MULTISPECIES: DUF2970 domain-containing protein [Halomonas]AYF35219.1 DUF2970 domain-containing protein [Halomonas alkaliphila]MCD6003222.1 DUF2970 domain-containing protein [Halomonas sp. IOP_6]MCD6436907.1 DUF2970 domain-containing protein [Halomonas sp.]MDX5975951.1 DUF2970 domain-containing protein [Halomonas alkaliphila]PAU72374.1 DUF2970 domain-containing protein [Halomonas humidisoli]